MTATIDDWRRLGQRVVARRTDLGYTQADVSARGGPSVSTLRLIEGGLQSGYRPANVRALEHAIGWTPGSVDAILGGGEATSAATPAMPATPPGGALATEMAIIRAAGLPPREQALLAAELDGLVARQAEERILQLLAWLRVADKPRPA